MANYTLSAYYNYPLNLAAGDTLILTRYGTVSPNDPNSGAAALLGAGANAVTIDGVFADELPARDGIDLNGPNNAVAINATALVVGSRDGLRITAGGSQIVITGQLKGGSGNSLNLQAGGNAVTLNATGFAESTGDALNIAGSGNTVTNAGRITSQEHYGLTFGSGGNVLTNSGTISGGTSGLVAAAGNTTSSINNSGLIRSTFGTAISTLSGVVMVNSGTVDGLDAGVSNITATQASSITNTGYIFGRSSFGLILGSNGNDVVVNDGFIQGALVAVALNGGNDTFDGRNGYQVGGVQGGSGDDLLIGGALNDFLYGGSDNDTLSGGAAGDYLDGGTGIDLVSYAYGGAVTVSLANPAANTGDAATDTFVSIEGIIGSGAGDVIIGSAAIDILFGGGGADGIAGGDGNDQIFGGDGGDVIAGQNGSDIITGGAGGDVLSGGADKDFFTYTSVADGGDLIQDFNAGGVRDVFDLRPLFDATGYVGNSPRAANILQAVQNGADTDVYVYSAFLFRIPGLYAPALDDTYFIFQ